jgi:hypothetical protein
MGTLIQKNDHPSIFSQLHQSHLQKEEETEDEFLHFSACNTELLAVKREDFFKIDKLQDPTNGQGWPNWDDVDFGYRAYLNDFQLMRSGKAIGYHWDYSIADRTVACRRWQRASKSAVLLFQTHPDLQSHIPMLEDKAPISWSEDSYGIITKKIFRSIASTQPIIKCMEFVTTILENYYPSALLLRPLYRWVAGGYMFQGYREGLREYGPVE